VTATTGIVTLPSLTPYRARAIRASSSSIMVGIVFRLNAEEIV
jgi:hypothetical protein